LAKIGGRERMEGKLKAKGLMVKVMNGGFPRVAKFVSIFMVKVVRMFFISMASRMRWRSNEGSWLRFLFGRRK
jgi:hypothetical protein